MGDVGSGYIAYVIAGIGMAAHENPTELWAWLILGGLLR